MEFFAIYLRPPLRAESSSVFRIFRRRLPHVSDVDRHSRSSVGAAGLHGIVRMHAAWPARPKCAFSGRAKIPLAKIDGRQSCAKSAARGSRPRHRLVDCQNSVATNVIGREFAIGLRAVETLSAGAGLGAARVEGDRWVARQKWLLGPEEDRHE
jgi:hypothetical protein